MAVATAPVLRVNDDNGVRILTLDRPEARNAFNAELYDAVRTALQDASADRDIAACVITGAGDIFSAGQDLKEGARSPSGHPFEDGRGFVPFARTLASFDKPLIAAVNGPAVGVGLTMLLHCDLVLVSEAARFRAPFVSLGIAPEAGSTLLLPARVGPQAAAHMLFTGEWMSAEESVARGLAWKLCAPQDLLAESRAVADAIAKMPLASVMATKRLLLAARSEATTAAFDREIAEIVRLVSGGRSAIDARA
jgi:enoyl-CoA hydratase/carnithine racemase